MLKDRLNKFSYDVVKSSLLIKYLQLEESTVPLAKLILSLTEEQNGLYFRYNGEAIPW